MIDTLVRWAEGNPGAIVFLTGIFQHPKDRGMIINTIEIAPKLRGQYLHILFKDLCDCDYEKVAILCRDCPLDLLQEAASTPDRSGKKMIEHYFN